VAQNSPQDTGADIGEQGEAPSESAPDQNADDPRWATVLSAIDSFKAENKEMRQQISELKADREASEAENAQLKSELSDVRTELETRPFK
jgi:predicted RNase H-like nuclease (RuvC/YqgF family)